MVRHLPILSGSRLFAPARVSRDRGAWNQAIGSPSTPHSRGMARSKLSSALPAALRRQLDLTAAIARKRLMEVHFRQAMELIEHVDGELEPRRTLDIYARLHKLLPAEAAA